MTPDYDSHHIMYVLGPRNNRPSNYVVSVPGARGSCTGALPAGCFRALAIAEILPLLRQLASGEADSQFLIRPAHFHHNVNHHAAFGPEIDHSTVHGARCAIATGDRGGGAAHGRSIDGTISQAAGMQSWIRDLIDLKTQISVLQNCMQQPASSHAAPASHYRVADNVNRGRRALPGRTVCCGYDLGISGRTRTRSAG